MTYNPPSRMYAPVAPDERRLDTSRAVCNKAGCITRVDTRRLRLVDREDMACSMCGETALILAGAVRS